jgi:mevalonate kinase
LNPERYYSHGKLLLCGEYAVLDGAAAFALPTIKGQDLTVEVTGMKGSGMLEWQGLDARNKTWFTASIQLPYFVVQETSDTSVAVRLVRFLINARILNPHFLEANSDYKVTTHLEFGLDEGLGSSSTLTNNIAQWAKINPFALHFNAFKGSGYDIAVAVEGKPLLYTMNGISPVTEVVEWNRSFTDRLFFVHLNKKQDSRQQIAQYKQHATHAQVAQITRISRLISINDDYFEFCLLMELAENEISQVLGMPTIKQQLFSDFHGTIKSLGAWGGDYILATGTDTEEYFKSKGYERIIPYKQMIKTE